MIAFLGRCLAMVLDIRSWPGDFLFLDFLRFLGLQKEKYVLWEGSLGECLKERLQY